MSKLIKTNFGEVNCDCKTCLEFAHFFEEISKQVPVCAILNGNYVELDASISDGDILEIITLEDKMGLKIYRRTCSLILAQAIKSIYPTCKLSTAPADDNGFYCDVDFVTPISNEDFAKIEEEMWRIIKANFKIEKLFYSKKQSLDLMREFDEYYKLQIIEFASKNNLDLSVYKVGDFYDVCPAPLLAKTGMIKAFKLLSITGAYVAGNKKNKMLTRIYGTAFPKKSQLNDYLATRKKLRNLEHAKLGKELGLFTTDDSVGKGLAMFLPKGNKIMQTITRYVEDDMEREGYQFVKTPIIAKSELFRQSGHLPKYKDKIFFNGKNELDGMLAIRPINSPFMCKLFDNTLRSYRELPVRYAETVTLARKEGSGEVHGIIRSRQFTVTNGVVFCEKKQAKLEFEKCVKKSMEYLKRLGLLQDVTFTFSKRINSSKINDEYYDFCEDVIDSVVQSLNLDCEMVYGTSFYYGPRLDFVISNVHRKDVLLSVSFDVMSAKNFNLKYISSGGEKKEPVVISTNSVGSYERVLAYLTEKYLGVFPLWIAPVQVKVLSMGAKNFDYARSITEKLRIKGIKVEEDFKSVTIGRKIKLCQLEKIPYMIIVGDKEEENKTISVRMLNCADSVNYYLDEFLEKINKEIILSLN